MASTEPLLLPDAAAGDVLAEPVPEAATAGPLLSAEPVQRLVQHRIPRCCCYYRWRRMRRFFRRSRRTIRTLARFFLLGGNTPRAAEVAIRANRTVALATIRRLKKFVIFTLISWTTPAWMQLWCFFRAWQLYSTHHDALNGECGEFVKWLYGFFLIPFILPCCTIILYLYSFWWTFFRGEPLLARYPQCRTMEPELWRFVGGSKLISGIGVTVGLIALIGMVASMRLGIQLRMLASRRRHTPKHVIDRLPLVAPTEVSSENVECSICLDAGDGADMWMRLPCQHLFHETCLRPWLSSSTLCPLCRRELPLN